MCTCPPDDCLCPWNKQDPLRPCLLQAYSSPCHNDSGSEGEPKTHLIAERYIVTRPDTSHNILTVPFLGDRALVFQYPSQLHFICHWSWSGTSKYQDNPRQHRRTTPVFRGFFRDASNLQRVRFRASFTVLEINCSRLLERALQLKDLGLSSQSPKS